MNKFKLPSPNDETICIKNYSLRIVFVKASKKFIKKDNLAVKKILNECIEFALNNLDDFITDNKLK